MVTLMLSGMQINKFNGQTIIEVSKLTRLEQPDGVVRFNNKTEPKDFAYGKPSPVRQLFHDRFQIGKVKDIASTEISIFLVLARSTRWAKAAVLIDNQSHPILNNAGKPQIVILCAGNVTSTKTIQQIADEAGCSYGAAAKALRKWEQLGIIKPLDRTYRTSIAKEEEKKSGRPVKLLRYSIDPNYVWNGYNWLGIAYMAHDWQNLKVLPQE